MADDRESTTQPTCFVISPIGERGTPIRRHADQVLKFLIEPVLTPKYRVVRADTIHAPGLITVQIVEYVMNAALVIADLSFRNANVFYELAIRHAIRKPYIHLLRLGEELPFDVHGMRVVQYDMTDPCALGGLR